MKRIQHRPKALTRFFFSTAVYWITSKKVGLLTGFYLALSFWETRRPARGPGSPNFGARAQ